MAPTTRIPALTTLVEGGGGVIITHRGILQRQALYKAEGSDRSLVPQAYELLFFLLDVCQWNI